MDRLDFEGLSAEAERYDEAVLGTSGIDHFCSSSFWVLPAVAHLLWPTSAWLWRSENGYVAMARTTRGDHSSVLHPLESMWALSSPLIGGDPEPLVEVLIERLDRDRDWDVAILAGIPETSPLWQKLISALSLRYGLSRGPTTRRYVADLTTGVDGFLAKRSRGFRRSLMKAERRAKSDGVRFDVANDVTPADADESFERLLAIERRSWKGQRGVGIDTDPMASFYRDMNRRLVARSARHLVFATIDGEDAAYILGGQLGATYRGLQFSFDHRFSNLSLGNLCQLEEIRRLSAAGVESYDLGTEVPYKRRWGDRVFGTSCLFIQP